MVSIINMRIFKVILVIGVAYTNLIEAAPASFLRLEHRTVNEDSPSLPQDNTDISEISSTASSPVQDTYDQRQNGTENYRIRGEDLLILVAPIESFLSTGGGLGDTDLLSGLGGIPMEKPKPGASDSKPNVSSEENSNENSKPGVLEKNLTNKPHLRFVNLLAPLLKRVAIRRTLF